MQTNKINLTNLFVGSLVSVFALGAMFSFATPAKAQTVAELQTMVNTLMAQIAALSGTASIASSMSYDFGMVTLKAGSQGSSVMALQSFLNAHSGAMLTADGKFGPATSIAVKTWQASRGLTADGMFGFNSRTAAQNQLAVVVAPAPVTPGPVTPGPVTPGTLDGQGTINDITVGSSDESEMNEGDSDVEIYAADVELDDNGNLLVQSVDVWFAETDVGGHSQKPWDYFKTVSLLVDGDEVASMDADSSSDWSSVANNGNISGGVSTREYRLRFTGLNFGLESDETTVVSVAVSSLNNIDSNDDGATWNVDLGDMRVVDGTGFTTNENYDVADSFSINSSSELASLDVSDSSDNMNATTIEVSKTSDTDGVAIYKFEIEEDNNVNVNIEQMTLTFVTPIAENVIIKRAYLYKGSSKVGEESMTANGVVVFDNMDIDISGNDTEDFTVKVDLEDTNNGVRYTEGNTIAVSVTSIDLFTDANENDEGDITPTVSATSETHELRTEGIMVEFVSKSEAKTFSADDALENDRGQFNINFKAQAFGSDMRLDKSCEEANADAAGQGVEYTITNNAANDTTCVLTSASTDSEDNADVYELDKGVWRNFTLTVEATAVTTAFAEVSVASINWGLLLTNLNANYYTFNLDNYKTGALSLNSL